MSGGNLGDLSLMELFRGEVETQNETLNRGLLELEEGAGGKAVETLMRAAHSIKGAARIVGLDLAVSVAHAMESVLDKARDGKKNLSSDQIDVLLSGVDFFTQLAGIPDAELEPWLEEKEPHAESLIEALESGAPLSTEPPPAEPKPKPKAKAKANPKPKPEPAPAAAEPVEDDGPADEPDLSMIDLFRVEVETQTETLNNGLIALETGASGEKVEPLMRAAHSIKGAARIVGLHSSVKLAHAMEDVLERARQAQLTLDSGGIDILLAGADYFTQLGQIPDDALTGWLQEQRARAEHLVRQLQSVQSGAAPAPAPPPEPEPEPLPKQVPAASRDFLPEPPAAEQAAFAPDAREPAKKAPPPEALAPADASSRVVRVTAENLDRMMALGAESLVQARQFEPLLAELKRFKKSQNHVAKFVARLRENTREDGSIKGDDILSSLDDMLGAIRQQSSHLISNFEAFNRNSTNLTDRLYREIISSRMRPFSDATGGFPRLVRDVSRQLGKKARLQVLGRSTEVDRDILQRLEAPLNHLIRNALDHGLEPPLARKQAGKAEEGTIQLEARHRSGMLLVTLRDDGRGISTSELQKRIIERGLVSEEMATNLSETELLDFLFLPGFSTSSEVTDISGRGVGLDVVQSMVHESGGSVRVFSKVNEGTTFQLQLPITRSVMRALMVQIAGEAYAFPLARIDRAIHLPIGQVKSIENRQFFDLDGRSIGLVSAAQVLELEDKSGPREHLSVVVVSERNHRYGLAVEEFQGERDFVVRPLDDYLGKVPDISASSLTEDGEPVLIIDVEDIARSIDSLLTGGNLQRIRGEGAAQRTAAKRVLVVDDSITVREVERKLLENHGYDVDVAVDGSEGWNAVRLGSYDLIISDVDMPRMNGIELVRRIKNDANLRDLPVMIVSYKDREEDRLRGMEAGANYYLTKSSFHDETLIEAVLDLIGEARGE
ncbi:MAG: hybrid sensor histidine kinase/response regulator [Verrucomicrobiota bacterium]